MVQEVLSDLYLLEIPLPNTPLKSLNSYLIKGERRNLIIDTGFNHEQCLEAMLSGLRELGADPGETDIFITHYHSDHAGLIPKLVTETSRIYCSEQDSFKVFRELPDVSRYWEDFRRFMLKHGFPETQLETAIDNNPGFKYRTRVCLNHTVLTDGNRLCAGDYRFKCIDTPGHTKGHMCLYEPDRKLLVAGDHILKNITPNISLSSDDGNPLEEYLRSLDKVEALDVGLVLPGHRSLITNCRRRIRELKHHYIRRFDEVLAILGKGNKTAYQVAAELKWDLACESWALFPSSQKLFAVWEALAYLKYLEEKRVIERKVRDRKVVFSVNS